MPRVICRLRHSSLWLRRPKKCTKRFAGPGAGGSPKQTASGASTFLRSREASRTLCARPLQGRDSVDPINDATIQPCRPDRPAARSHRLHQGRMACLLSSPDGGCLRRARLLGLQPPVTGRSSSPLPFLPLLCLWRIPWPSLPSAGACHPPCERWCRPGRCHRAAARPPARR
jgi:hypothetical protein